MDPRRTTDPTVIPLELARVAQSGDHAGEPGSAEVYGFVVRDAQDCILVDTGVGHGSELVDGRYRPRRVSLTAALLEAGVEPGEITFIVNSHLHFDHCGNNREFPGVPILVQHAELQAARQPRYTVEAWLDFPGASYMPLDGRHRVSPRVELLPTPGHTPGHQSVVVRAARGIEVIVAQASYSAAEFTHFGDAPRCSDELAGSKSNLYLRANADWSAAAYLKSVATLHRLRPRRAYFSHDATVWAAGGEA